MDCFAMRSPLVSLAFAACVGLSGCANEEPTSGPATGGATAKESAKVKTEKATFGAGCFWGVEAEFSKVPGVVATAVGYCGGKTKSPTYKDVCTDETGHAEVIEIDFDPTKVSFEQLVDVFWELHDPTTLNRQGPDVGSQYRSVIFFQSPEQERIAKASKEQLDKSGVFRNPIVTQIVPAQPFYRAEEYHQKYFEKKGMAASCHLRTPRKKS